MHGKRYLIVFLVCIISVLSMTSCSKVSDNQTSKSDSESEKIVLEMEMDENYHDSDPFENGRLFCVTKDLEALNGEVFFRMNGERGTVEIKDRDADNILWSYTWEENVNINVFAITLNNLKKGKDYVIRFTGTKINHAIVKVTLYSNMVQEKEKPSK